MHRDETLSERFERASFPDWARRLHTAESSRDWLPMNMAPKTGEPILAWVRWANSPAAASIIAYDGRDWKRAGTTKSVATSLLVGWMPLPQGPGGS
jgi:hypothetical protein